LDFGLCTWNFVLCSSSRTLQEESTNQSSKHKVQPRPKTKDRFSKTLMTASVETAPLRRNPESRPAIQSFARFRAPFSLRCGAILIDYIILVAILAFSTLVSRVLGGGARSAGNSSETVGLLLAIVVAALDLGVLPGLTGLTVGKWATGLRIIREDGTPIGIGRAFLRHFVGYPLSFVTLGLGFLAAAFTPRGRGLHDLIANTIVVREGPPTVVRESRVG
jgi:uncharacterized RDD family membrane protein YckC